ncbi:bifunctional 4-hydroxy-2-oxoglutarate aldolase/2-dehydro-3-deoxy-phosphogluconate aldolase [Parvularcula sp. LCG005]|uniref:bifunctional 4-hydroxy-2-oxoglutarate aldolase/2-dehydro-3-deoxy-phosphogluconate aldolase n=1 Tax=Parvularcula sp. LCG005 TaxID=3078805 RepID=UPI002942694B|nr:bifunctional 4-hydroxy-2-oxoglutarate aldolase/2-dehydro-3-deoxy-phosphogluconate aldolase [Parvularcula sp. LCG005]WOI52886.1 bifunctional 4-hydroxy-2-oxoglutarate aldolase/2-dehydro-3-deoxy-phosphogluconate aldolase [Parvularcula sp. LCG005]
MTNRQATAIDRVLAGVRVMPVVVIHDADHALPLADALLEGGIKAMEVTLRTDAAIDAVARIAKDRPEMTIGTGTIISPDDLARSMDAGAVFGVSPGLTDMLAKAAALHFDDCPLLPGTATASDVMRALEYGFERLKFFPAEAAGGVPMLKSLGGPLLAPKFCPTGGLTPENAGKYLSLSNVFCAGGSWLTPADKMKAGDWAGITAIAKDAAAL